MDQSESTYLIKIVCKRLLLVRQLFKWRQKFAVKDWKGI